MSGRGDRALDDDAGDVVVGELQSQDRADRTGSYNEHLSSQRWRGHRIFPLSQTEVTVPSHMAMLGECVHHGIT